MKRAVVLSGGGSRGSYQIGVWKALRKLRIKYDIVTGTSVGALNGALMTQKTYLRSVWLWYNLNFKDVFKCDIKSDYKTKEGRKTIFKTYARAILMEKGMDVTNLEEKIDKTLSETKLRDSNIDFGLVTVNLSSLKPLRLTKKDIPKGKLKDYLIASATCFPAFKKKSIDDKNYIDGGYYDNLPINLAVKMGAEEVIAINLGTVGFKKHIKDKNIKITYITPRNNLGSFFIFHKDLARRGIRLGYNDTMKIFGKLDGNKYTFKYNHLHKNFIRYKDIYKESLENLFQKNHDGIIANLFKLTTFKNEIKESDLNKIIESLGRIFKIDDSYIYSINKFNKTLIKRLDEIPFVDRKLVTQRIKNKEIRELVNSKYVIKYIYDKLCNQNNNRIKKELSSIALLLPQELIGALYLYIIKNNR